MRLLDYGRLAELLERHPRASGAAALRRVLTAHDVGTTLTRSELEERFLALCDRAGIRRPRINEPVALPDGSGLIVDALWQPERLVVETDGWRFHSSRAAFEEDRRRDASLTVAGYEVLRFTWRQVVHERDTVAAVLRARLRARCPT